MLSVNRMLNTEQEHHYATTSIYSSPSIYQSSSIPPQRSSMLDIANLLCRDDDEDDSNSQLTTPCLSVTSSPMTSHTKLNPPSFINLSNLDAPPPQYNHLEYEDHSSMSPLTPPLRSSAYYHHNSLSADTLHSNNNNNKTMTSDYHYHHRVMFSASPNCNEDHPPLSPVENEHPVNDEDNKPNNSIKTKRRRASNKQLQVLQSVFEHTFFPSTHVRSQLGRQLGMSPRTVQIWFQNRRQALRTKEKRNCQL